MSDDYYCPLDGHLRYPIEFDIDSIVWRCSFCKQTEHLPADTSRMLQREWE